MVGSGGWTTTYSDLMRRAMTQSEGNISAAAKLLGISRPTLYDLLKQYRMHS